MELLIFMGRVLDFHFFSFFLEQGTESFHFEKKIRLKNFNELEGSSIFFFFLQVEQALANFK